MKNLTETLAVVLAAKTIKGTSFIGLQNYENAKGEISNQTIVAGITYENCLVNDFKALQDNKDKAIELATQKYGETIALKAYNDLYTSLAKRLSSDEVKENLRLQNDATILRSDAQINAYSHIAKGAKVCNDTQQLHIFGLVVKKTIVQAIEYKAVNSRELTLAKNLISKTCDFKQSKYRNFIFDKGTVKIQGMTL